MATKTSQEVCAGLNHPVIDGDGHIVEILPVFLDYLRQAGGQQLADRYGRLQRANSPYDDAEGWFALSPDTRRQQRLMRPPSWLVNSASARERATTMLPNLIRERLDEFGIDFSILYTSVGIPISSSNNDDLRLGGCRALNLMYADMFDAHRDRMTPSAVIPIHTPDEAIAEIEFAVKELGFKTVTIPGCVTRPVADAGGSRHAVWIDPLAVDSLYDYDPVWAKCIELGVAPATHHSGMGAGWGARATSTNFMYNHIGHFAAGADAVCKALFMGGVTRRFPDLRIGFLEGGAGWAVSLLNDITEHWEKRNIDSLRKVNDPQLLNRADLSSYFRRYGADLLGASGDPDAFDSIFASPPGVETAEDVDDWGAIGLTRKADIGKRFLPNFFVGCEADDRMNGAAFDPRLNPFGAKLNAFLGSDIGHWDVPDPTQILADAWALVTDGLLSEEDFAAFTFGNVARLHTEMNPKFFEGTAVESAVAARRADAAQ